MTAFYFPELFLAKLFWNHKIDLFNFSLLNSIWLMYDFLQSMAYVWLLSIDENICT